MITHLDPQQLFRRFADKNVVIRRILSGLALIAAVCSSAGGPVAASTDSTAIATLNKLFTQPAIDPALFAPNFVSKIPVSDVQAFVTSYVTRIGAPTSIDKSGFEYALTSPKGSIKVDIAFDMNGKVSSLLFHDELSGDNLSALQRVLSADTISSDWFEASYLHDVPTQKLVTLLADMHARLGKFVRVDTRDGKYWAVFDKGESHAQVSADVDDRIDYLAFSKV